MKKTLLIVLAAVGLSACGNNPRKTTADMPQSDCVEVLCFHGAKRCATCIAIENGVKEVIETDFGRAGFSRGSAFPDYDIAKPENERGRTNTR